VGMCRGDCDVLIERLTKVWADFKKQRAKKTTT
jgi:hypothetical protein